MKLVMIFGPGAVGKMTVGQELAKITDLRLFHNHMSIEFIIDVFGYYDSLVISRVRDVVFEEFVKSNNYGLIFTYVWAFDQESEWEIIRKYHDFFTNAGVEIFYIELESSQETRLIRNITENRIMNKPSKRNIELSNQRVINMDSKYRLNSLPNEVPYPNYLRINNENMGPEEVAKLIKNTFNL